MSASVKYALLAMGAIGVGTLALWPFLDGPGRNGVLLAGAIALPVQIGAFGIMVHKRGEPNGFLAAWIGGTIVRMAVIGVAALVTIRADVDGAMPMLLALAGFFFGLLLLEPVCFRIEPAKAMEA